MPETHGTARPPRLYTTTEVARLFRVDPKTVTRWVRTGQLRALRTPGGHARILADDVDAALAGLTQPPPARGG
ncbi:helix-turn-helix domain-containing protein [Streptomonospora nanhaiensis]|uniref:Excisionase family DNA binding protein n=1 Tax=Streptomonospora nanhaiensis TaxID=1323731 RepID=A0A853BVE4_9ACTN|nr:helix-turn-helix domain-containing protein [Streptomonospora nanhaiensis]MBV2364696.1 helix-turn-helix domain-containing protein [Streptomonospora nanhaiensis]MBX9388324.1 helix-turn-helix domain-containing protein [Streptomonospora nanhaiensis]NYI99258.1 excisionase family DNA binding protein [Streptomonospora nanhaiensis]